MTKPLIAPDGPEWANLAALPQDIAAWEAKTGRRLPDVYRRFMTTYNGGRIYPSRFKVLMPAEAWGMENFNTWCDPLYRWETAVAHWAGATYYDSTPPDFFFIGCNPGGMEILMSLRGKDHGKVYTWLGSNQPWGSEDNTEANIYPQADNFTAFLAQMFETPEGDAMKYWSTPRHQLLARDLILT
jgi:SMI1 / KNR4 family (SUKH-1)